MITVILVIYQKYIMKTNGANLSLILCLGAAGSPNRGGHKTPLLGLGRRPGRLECTSYDANPFNYGIDIFSR
jgi:hypothetical protein